MIGRRPVSLALRWDATSIAPGDLLPSSMGFLLLQDMLPSNDSFSGDQGPYGCYRRYVLATDLFELFVLIPV